MKTALQKEFEDQTPTIRGITGNEYNLVYCAWLENKIEILKGPTEQAVVKETTINYYCKECKALTVNQCKCKVSTRDEMESIKGALEAASEHGLTIEVIYSALKAIGSSGLTVEQAMSIGLGEWDIWYNSTPRKVPEAQLYDEPTECKVCGEEFPLHELGKCGICKECIGIE